MQRLEQLPAISYEMPVATLAELGSAVRSARKGLGLTQEAAAALCGVSLPFLNQLEGAKRPHLSTTKVLAVCAALGIHLSAGGYRVRPGTGLVSIKGLPPTVIQSGPGPSSGDPGA